MATHCSVSGCVNLVDKKCGYILCRGHFRDLYMKTLGNRPSYRCKYEADGSCLSLKHPPTNRTYVEDVMGVGACWFQNTRSGKSLVYDYCYRCIFGGRVKTDTTVTKRKVVREPDVVEVTSKKQKYSDLGRKFKEEYEAKLALLAQLEHKEECLAKVDTKLTTLESTLDELSREKMIIAKEVADKRNKLGMT